VAYVRGAELADLAVRPWPSRSPFDGVVAVVDVELDRQPVLALGLEPAQAVADTLVTNEWKDADASQLILPRRKSARSTPGGTRDEDVLRS
jgi:hypothetical protein